MRLLMEHKSFADILAEKIAKAQVRDSARIYDSPAEIAFHTTLDITNIRVKSWSHKGRTPYKSRRPQDKKQNNKKQNCVQKTTMDHLYKREDLNCAQYMALEKLVSLGARKLDREEFFGSEIKKAFRRLVLNMHPDTNPGAETESFMCLMTSYQVLMAAPCKKVERKS